MALLSMVARNDFAKVTSDIMYLSNRAYKVSLANESRASVLWFGFCW